MIDGEELGEGKHSIVLWLGLCLLASLCLWTVNTTSVSQFSSSSLGEIGWLQCAEVGDLPPLLCQLGSGLLVSPKLGLCQHEVFNSQTCPHWASNLAVTSQAFLPRHWFLQAISALSLCSGKKWYPFFIHLSLYFWGSALTLTCCQDRVELSSSLHVAPETGSQKHILYFQGTTYIAEIVIF